MGRTGRHEEGKVVYIVSEGQEEDKFHSNADVSISAPVCHGMDLSRHSILLWPCKHMHAGLQSLASVKSEQAGELRARCGMDPSSGLGP